MQPNYVSNLIHRTIAKEHNMSQYIVDHFGDGVAQVTDGVETIYLPQGRHIFNKPIQNVSGHIARIQSPLNTPTTALLQDAPIEVAMQGMSADVKASTEQAAPPTINKKKGS